MRLLRRALVLLVLAAAVLLAVADRLTEQAAAKALSVQIRRTALLAGDPSVRIRGFPFLTQAAGGRYAEIDVTTHGIHRGGLRIDTVSAQFRGVHVPLSAALAGRVGAVPIDAATGTLTVSYADLAAALLTRGASVSAAAGQLTLHTVVTVGGRPVAVTAPLDATVSGGALVLTPGPLVAAGRTLTGATRVTQIALAKLPFGLTPTAVTVGPTALSLAGRARGLTVPVPPDAAAT